MRISRTASLLSVVCALVSCVCQAQTETITPAVTLATNSALVPANILARKHGVLRIGVTQPGTTFGPATPSLGYSEMLRQLFEKDLKGPTIEVVALTAILSPQTDAEAKQQDCDYVLYSALTQKQAGSFGLLKNAATLASLVPMGGVVRGVASAASTVSAASAITGTEAMSNLIRAKSQVSLEYKLAQAGSQNIIVANTIKAKATQNGQDIITPLVMQAASDIVHHTRQ